MGWGTSVETVAKMADYLDELKEGRATVWHIEEPAGEPAGGIEHRRMTNRFADRVRAALYIAHHHHSREFPELANAYSIFSIHVPFAGRVEARIKASPANVSTARYDARSTPIHGVEDQRIEGFRPAARVGLSTAEEAIDSWNSSQPSSDPVLLQNTELSLGELLKLHAWAERHTPRLMLLVPDDRKHITISLYEAGVAEIASWQPPEVPEETEDYPNLDPS